MEPLPFPSTPVLPLKRPRPSSTPSHHLPSRPPKRPRPSHPIPRFLYAPSRHLDISLLHPLATLPRLVDVLISAEHFTTANPALAARQLWGTASYTDDSDVVAVLAHSGHCTPPETALPNLEYVRARLTVFRLEKTPDFETSDAGGLTSRFWPGDRYDGACLSVESVELWFQGDETVSVERPVYAKISAEVPGLVPMGLVVGRGRKPMGKCVKVAFDMCNEPCRVYELGAVEGVEERVEERLEERLEKEVMYVENGRERFEIAKVEGAAMRFGRVKEGVMQSMLVESVLGKERSWKFPMKEDDVIVLDTLPWRKIYWDKGGVSVGGKYYRLAKMFFRERDE